jgi:hypothetical protein
MSLACRILDRQLLLAGGERVASPGEGREICAANCRSSDKNIKEISLMDLCVRHPVAHGRIETLLSVGWLIIVDYRRDAGTFRDPGRSSSNSMYKKDRKVL